MITRYRTVAAERETKAEGIRTLAGHRRAVTACDRAVITRNLQVQSDDRGLARLAISPVVG